MVVVLVTEAGAEAGVVGFRTRSRGASWCGSMGKISCICSKAGNFSDRALLRKEGRGFMLKSANCITQDELKCDMADQNN